MKRTVSFWWWSELLTQRVTYGSQMCVAAQPIERMIFSTFPQPDSKNWMHDDDVIVVDALAWNLKKSPWADTVVMTDSFYYTFNGGRVFHDTVGVPDSIALYLYKVFGDTVAVNDDFLIGQREAMHETVTATDHGQILMQNYFTSVGAPSGYFAADYFGYGYTW